MSQTEATALVATMDEVTPSSPTACAGWTAHHIVAHLAAGSKEIADLVEERLAGGPARPTQAFEDREPPFRRMPADELRTAWASQARRKSEAVDALAAAGAGVTVAFTEMDITAAQLSTHSRSEAAIHRWDIAGDDPTSDALLAQPELIAHAVEVLNSMPVLLESPRARMAHTERAPFTIVLRADAQPDVVLYKHGGGHARFDLLTDQSGEGDAIVETDAAHRLLVLWGRRSSTRPAFINADPHTTRTVEAVLWPNAVPWPN